MKIIKISIILYIFLSVSGIYRQYSQHSDNSVYKSAYTADAETGITEEFSPAYDYCNSTGSRKVIKFSLMKPGFVNIKIYDYNGNTIDELARSSFGKGYHELKWNISKFQGGIYYYSIITNEYSVTGKIR